MKAFRKELWFEIPQRRAFVNITPEVATCLRASCVREGLCRVNAHAYHGQYFHARTGHARN